MENLYEEKFEKILDDDEKIVKTFKPNKLKFFFSATAGTVILFLFIFLFMLIPVFVADSETGETMPIFVFGILLGVFVFIELIIVAISAIYYKNVYYAYTNKRVIIRSGVFGVDFKSLDMSMIGAVDVYVSLFDKILRKNTGTICFGSTASPMLYGQNGYGAGYKFAHIEFPYETCKEIKTYMDKRKSGFLDKTEKKETKITKKNVTKNTKNK